MHELDKKNTKESLSSLFNDLRKQIPVLRTESLAVRKERLLRLRKWIHASRPAIHNAIFADLGKPAMEVDGTEVFHVLAELKHALANLDQWAAPKKIDAPLTMLGTRSFIKCEPRGLCLIVSPWNYPFSLAVGPLISALAAGNRVILKPSEHTPTVSALIAKMVSDVFKPSEAVVCEGGAHVSKELLQLPFDHIFFTGSPAIGKMVMKAAAENLTAVTLELGGKSPAIVTRSANLKDAAQRIAVSKFVNNGQTCIAPDYVFVDAEIASSFTKELALQVQKLFTKNQESFEASKHYGRIVNEGHFNRLHSLLQDAVQQGAELILGGAVNAASRFFHPTILTHIPPSSKLMEEEIFGPILPIMTYQRVEEAIAFINQKPKPLALYVFTQTKKLQEMVLRQTSSGAACVNDCAIHFLHQNFPFGGVNNSGMGRSHGYSGFLAFSNEKPVLKQRSGLTSVKLFFPPYTAGAQKIMDWFLKLFF